jgi:alpha-L-arabinofuranosidase
MTKVSLLLVICVLAPRVNWADEIIQLSVQPSASGPAIDRHLFGQFAEHLGRGVYEGIWVGRDSKIANVRGIRSDVVAALRDLHVPVVRWPGGCFADEYHWRKGVGPSRDRPVTLNPNWGGVLEGNAFGTDEFMDFAQQIGADAFVSINVGSGTAEEASDWLEYMTAAKDTALAEERARNGHAAPYGVAFLGVGNESWGCGGSMSPDHYVEELKRFSRYARNFNSAQPMQRIAVGSDGADASYTEAVMRAWERKPWSWDIEGVSLHAYTVGKWPPSYRATGFTEDEYATFLKETLRMEDQIRINSAIMDKYDPAKKISLVVDEWGSWLAPTPGSTPEYLEQQNSQRDALIAALNLDIFARHADRVRMANIAQMVNVLQAMILTDHDRILLTPTYYVFRMYVPFQDATLVPLSMDAGTYEQHGVVLPRLDALAARTREGKLWLAVTNVDARRPATVRILADGIKSATGQMLSAPHFDSVNTFADPLNVHPTPLSVTSAGGKLHLNLPPHSITVVSLQ